MNTMRSLSALAAIVLSASLFSACAWPECVSGTGKAVRKPLQVQPFHAIVVEGAVDVHLTQGDAQSVEVEAQPNLAELLVTEVANGTWRITTTKCWSTKEHFVVHITVPVIDKINVMGSGDVTGHGTFQAPKAVITVQGSGDVDLNLKSPDVDVNIQGSGDVKLGGECTRLSCDVHGSGDVKAGGLKAAQVETSIMGSGNVTVSASESLDAHVMGSGDVRYKGNPPSVKQNISGSGTVKPAE